MPKPKSRRKPPAPRPLFIAQLKEEIRRRAQERQARIERGELDLPIHYAPLPTEELFDLLSQLEYRVPSLELAIPPPEPGPAARLKRSCKALVCKALRWLLIRQVEFNAAALRQGYETARLLGLSDRNVGELMAALTALKLQVHTLAGRLARLEQGLPGEARAAAAEPTILPPGPALAGESQLASDMLYRAYLPYFKERLAVLVLGCGADGFLKTLIAEGVSAQGVEPDPALAEEAREHELPVVCAPAADYVGRLADDSLGAVYLGPTLTAQPARELARLLELCWAKLRKGGLLLAAATAARKSQIPNPKSQTNSKPQEEIPKPAPLEPGISEQHAVWNLEFGSWNFREAAVGPPAELLSFLLDSACFAVLDYLFSDPARPDLPAVLHTSSGRPFDRRQYGGYTIIARK